MDDLIEYFTDMFHLDRYVVLPSRVVTKLNALDRAERGELKSRLFTEAKRLGCGGDGLRAIRWLETTFDLIEKNSFRLHEVLFSPGQDIPENIAFYMSQATKSIDLCVFTISDDVLSACLKTMKDKGVKIRIITDNNKMRDTGSQIKELARYGIDVKVDNSRYHMHNKFGIIYGRIAFTGSYNWTYTAKAHNQENLVITTNFTIVHRFICEFEMLWQQMYTLKVKQMKDGQIRVKVDIPKGQELSETPYLEPKDSRAKGNVDDDEDLEDEITTFHRNGGVQHDEHWRDRYRTSEPTDVASNGQAYGPERQSNKNQRPDRKSQRNKRAKNWNADANGKGGSEEQDDANWNYYAPKTKGAKLNKGQQKKQKKQRDRNHGRRR